MIEQKIFEHTLTPLTTVTDPPARAGTPSTTWTAPRPGVPATATYEPWSLRGETIVELFFNIVDCTEKKDDDYLVVKGGHALEKGYKSY